MSASLSADVLVLNKHWTALRIMNAAEALADLFVGRVEAVDRDFQTYDFHSWHELSLYKSQFEPQKHSFIKTVRNDILIPSVVRLLKHDKVNWNDVRLSRKNIYARDNNTCQYTGKKLPASQLNLDHVIPRSRGGKSTWTNLVCCSVEINTIKGNKTPKEAGLKLIRQPRKPKPGELLFKSKRFRNDSWKHFVDAAYWNVELTD